MTKPVRKSDGLKALNMLKTLHGDKYVPKQKKRVGVFGIVEDNGFENKIAWVVGDRKYMRHGVVGKRGHLGPYQQLLFDDMFRNWGK
jgi:hypothetical protein